VDTDSAVLTAVLVGGLISLAISVVVIVATWRVYTKAGKPGWAAIVPFYNVYVLLKIVGRPGWWLLLYLVPIVDIVIAVVVCVDLAKAFGKSGGFAVLLFLLPFIGFPLLAFGDATYLGPLADLGFQQRIAAAVPYQQAPQRPAQYPPPSYPPPQPGPPPQEQYPPP
jgi:hypothetical protein